MFSTVKNRQNIQDKQKSVVLANSAHGGMDGGAQGVDGTSEKDLNLSIALKLSRLLKLSGYEVILTRKEDVSTDDSPSGFNKKGDLQNRIELMNRNKNAIFVSIHLNKFTTCAARGAQVFYSQNAECSKELGQSIQDSLRELLQPENNRTIKRGTSSTYILKNATIPAVIVECGFLSNKQELELLKNDEYQNKLAFVIASGILNFKGMI